MQNRREFILRSSLAVAAGALGSTRLFGQQAPAAAPQPPTVPVFTPIRRNLGTFTARGGTMGWLITKDAVLVVDSQFADTAQMFADEVVSTKYYVPGHTSGDAVIFFQRANIVHMGDLMSHQRHPRVDRPAGASIRNWLVSLEKVVKDHNNDTVYIFGHSKVGAPVTGPKQDLLALRDYFSAMLEYVQKGIAA